MPTALGGPGASLFEIDGTVVVGGVVVDVAIAPGAGGVARERSVDAGGWGGAVRAPALVAVPAWSFPAPARASGASQL